MDNYNVGKEEQTSKVCEPSGSWGGSWTEQKLDAFEKYVNAYLTIMNSYRNKYNWKLIYFDGFAGSGSRIIKNQDSDNNLLSVLFSDNCLNEEELSTYKGAAERVLNIKQQGFDYYYFVDLDADSSDKLKERLRPFQKDKNLEFRHSDANKQIELLTQAQRKDKKYKSLVLLDPFGMQVNWNSIEMFKNIAADLWILIPTGVIVNRLLDRKGKLEHIDKLVSFFGKDEPFLRDYFYKTRHENTLFGESEIVEKVKDPITRIAELYIQQLGAIFKYVTEKPLVLYNTKNIPIFHFVFASNNKNAKKIAHEIINK